MDSIDFIKQFPVLEFKKGESVLEQGEVTTTLLAIQKGFVKVTAINEAGGERLLWLAGRYDIAPTEHLFSMSTPLDFFYTALSDGSAYQIDKKAFLDFARSDAAMMTEVAVSMSTHYDDLLSRVSSAEQVTVRDKLITTLQYLVERFSANTTADLYELGLTLTHQDIADMIGSTRETTSLELAKLRDEKQIDYSRTKFIVHLPLV